MARKKEDTPVERLTETMKTGLMINPLLNTLRENDKKNLFKTNVSTAFFKTGYPLFDYYFGSVINIHDEMGEITRQEPRIGQAGGTANMIIGNTGSGKTTFAIQAGSNIIRPYKNASLIHFDCEHRMDISRAEVVSQLPSSDFEDGGRYILKSGNVGLDTMQETIVRLYAAKMKMRDELTIDSGILDEFGRPVRVLEPTVIIIDSITSVISETFSPDNAKDVAAAEALRSNTEGARDAKSLKGFFKDILPLCKDANIILYMVNHINTNMSMNAFVPVAKQQNFLKQDESIPGGKTLLYYPFNIIKLIAKPGDDFADASDGFAGHIVVVEPIKSSSNQSGNSSKGIFFELVFSFKHGFDSLRSLINYGKDKGIIEGNKPRMKFKDDPSFTFGWKDIMKEKDEKPIWDNIKQFVYPELKSHLPFIEPSEAKFDQRSMDY